MLRHRKKGAAGEAENAAETDYDGSIKTHHEDPMRRPSDRQLTLAWSAPGSTGAVPRQDHA
ncbi:hypothetical protein soil367_04890 [Hydrocarboniclastica marina]|uniref:Uncharacterized protein n=1 Tax=Hydrocarboniclastica marina TaxID=2259620 RepID=A0A4P7XEJ4_9ALTE|nr:hypothetical protein soil367_04890 [Hydrocarboniclastica marina]